MGILAIINSRKCRLAGIFVVSCPPASRKGCFAHEMNFDVLGA